MALSPETKLLFSSSSPSISFADNRIGSPAPDILAGTYAGAFGTPPCRIFPATPPDDSVEVRPDPAELAVLNTSSCALCLAAFCAAVTRGSMFCDLSHHTVAFCFRINATYEEGVFVAVDRPEVDRRG